MQFIVKYRKYKKWHKIIDYKIILFWLGKNICNDICWCVEQAMDQKSHFP